jgi:hypothetical protein
MLEKNTKNEEKMDTPIGENDLPIEQKVDNLARNLFFMLNQQKELSRALDNVYIQVCTLVEILAKKEIIDEKSWEETLGEVTTTIKEQIEGMMKNAENASGSNNGKNTDGTDENQGSRKIITPDSGIIIPGQI